LPANAAVRSPFVTQFVTRPPAEAPRSTPVQAAPERLLTVAEVATFLGVSRATIYALVERGDLAHVRVTNAIRIRPADAAAFIARGGSR
jgi:excisionase family DNA binding protein